MKLTVLVIIAVVFLSVFLYRNHAKGFGLPPHEFAYGMPLKSIDDLPAQVDQFLSLQELDPDKIEIETFAGNSRDETLDLLIKNITSKHNDTLNPLIASLKEIDALPKGKEKAIRLIKTILPYRNQLRDEENQDYLIVFIYYGLKQPSDLSLSAKGQIENLVAMLDTPKQTEIFKKGRCPKNYLAGNINIYPLALENTFWHKTKDVGAPKSTPILEIRFMGLKGIFKYLLIEAGKRASSQFKHLDGEIIE